MSLTRRALLAGAAALAVTRATAQQPPPPDPRLAAAAAQIALAWVVTGDPAIDRASEAGLIGLSAGLTARTTVEPGPPVAVDLDADDLSLLTFLYWPVTEAQPLPTPAAYLRLEQFLRTGGMILFDTRDGDIAGLGGPDGSPALRALAAPLAIPPLAPLPIDHVLTRSFYLLDTLPGRWQGPQVWVEAPPPAIPGAGAGPVTNDGVSPVIIGGNSWAEAWAIDRDGLPLFTVGRGFEGERQRELALRAGINIVMYVLTGNYKADQIHVPELLERLGRRDAMPFGGIR
ncbi:DUF4159 domain-containing protein [Paracoccus sp. S-4012]|uniref:DUF4159 domain-containing protein n=1 Tax=Paracoccus sp. S-4012 TaxID=2665648 RepID=UPI001E4DA6E5|nr:DUF4159 domain-containing protein [Paracoccus sp. S-4012]